MTKTQFSVFHTAILISLLQQAQVQYQTVKNGEIFNTSMRPMLVAVYAAISNFLTKVGGNKHLREIAEPYNEFTEPLCAAFSRATKSLDDYKLLMALLRSYAAGNVQFENETEK
jgi:hypothetical protein